jgi:hypothetical protein
LIFDILSLKTTGKYSLGHLKGFIVPNPTNGSPYWLYGKLVYIEDHGIYRIRGIETFSKNLEATMPIGVLVTENIACNNYEKLQELVEKYWSSRDDALFHIHLYTEKYAADPGVLEQIFKIVRQNLALALTDPSPYMRCLAEFLSKE